MSASVAPVANALTEAEKMLTIKQWFSGSPLVCAFEETDAQNNLEAIFDRNGVRTVCDILLMSDDDVKELRLPFGLRNRLLAWIKKYNPPPRPPSPPRPSIVTWTRPEMTAKDIVRHSRRSRSRSRSKERPPGHAAAAAGDKVKVMKGGR